MQESINPEMILRALLRPMDGGIMNIGPPTPGTQDAAELWKSPVINDPTTFSKIIENRLPGSTQNMWDMYQNNKQLPQHAVNAMLKEHYK